jgi:hypothetical protein
MRRRRARDLRDFVGQMDAAMKKMMDEMHVPVTPEIPMLISQ